MYTYVLYLNKRMITSNPNIDAIFKYIHTLYNKDELLKFNPEYYGNDFVTKFTYEKKEIYIIREKTDFIRNSLLTRLKNRPKPPKLRQNLVMTPVTESEELDVFIPHQSPETYPVGALRTGLDNNMYKVVQETDKKVWKIVN